MKNSNFLIIVQDHPRLRGEHTTSKIFHVAVTGSPPPTRGTQVYPLRQNHNQGITPAYAGNTYITCITQVSFQDHPRLRGEHLLQVYQQDFFLGSPPPTRGTHDDEMGAPHMHRITPAYAGNTKKANGTGQLHKDHPRLRGEHKNLLSVATTTLGSPPPTRGTLKLCLKQHHKGRITPAYAGNTDHCRL